MASKTPETWPPSNGLTTKNVPRKDVILVVHASTRINAPAKQVFDAVLRVNDYQHWNRFCPKVTIQSQPQVDGSEPVSSDMLHKGTIFTFYAIMDAAKPDSPTPTQLIVTDISTPAAPSDYLTQEVLESESTFTADLQSLYRISWRCEGGFVARGLKTERFHEIIIVDDHTCEVRTWECSGGLLARTVKWMYQKTLMEKFKMWCDDLKQYCERDDHAAS